jgi:hypothetical protein
MDIPIIGETRRTCGTCQLCCKVMAVQELEKGRNDWCKHALAAGKGKGCNIYTFRPKSCLDFACGWLEGIGPDYTRPDKIHGFIVPTKSGSGIVIHEDPGYPGVAREALAFLILACLDNDHPVIIATGLKRTLLTRPANMGDPVEQCLVVGPGGDENYLDAEPLRVNPEEGEEAPAEARPGADGRAGGVPAAADAGGQVERPEAVHPDVTAGAEQGSPHREAGAGEIPEGAGSA